jgi:hypothetical protein
MSILYPLLSPTNASPRPHAFKPALLPPQPALLPPQPANAAVPPALDPYPLARTAAPELQLRNFLQRFQCCNYKTNSVTNGSACGVLSLPRYWSPPISPGAGGIGQSDGSQGVSIPVSLRRTGINDPDTVRERRSTRVPIFS